MAMRYFTSPVRKIAHFLRKAVSVENCNILRGPGEPIVL